MVWTVAIDDFFLSFFYPFVYNNAPLWNIMHAPYAHLVTKQGYRIRNYKP